ncbi:aldolase/citrate lyase family protein [Acrocarpospora catenulata]|uniref:aldolase/citrate lyase family protein n=1 Tax=Acrocarpospora catenulata TaxID=2836182 RepID=UPI001BDA9CF8|nr:aldolase/citrate lyase family protein [Acrocarpospora catenulata]
MGRSLLPAARGVWVKIPAVEAIEDIVETAGLDAVVIGPFDLARSGGLAADSAAFGDLVTRVEKAVTGRIALGGVAADVAAAEDFAVRGYSFAMVGADTSLLDAAAGSLMERGAA